LDVIRDIPDHDLQDLTQGILPPSLETATLDFVLAGAARAQRGQSAMPMTMLVHVSHLVVEQLRMSTLVQQRFTELKDEWRYQRTRGIRDRLRRRWDEDMRPVTRATHLERDVPFEDIEPHIGPFFESVQTRVVNSSTGEVLDYEREPGLKAIAVGGNRLSRGLTLEGLIISYYVRRSVMYDTLMQMGRWFGYRPGYEDLTRIYTTAELAGWFSELAFVEHRLREDLRIYEEQELTPVQVGMRIWQHPTMQVTSPLKRRFASSTTISQTYSLGIEQTFKFPLNRLDDLAVLAEENLLEVRDFLNRLGAPQWYSARPVWSGVPTASILDFLSRYRTDAQARSISLPLICAYIERQVAQGELAQWTVAVRGRESRDRRLGEANWGVPGGQIYQLSRTRIRDTDSVGVITSPGDEAIGLGPEALARMQEYMQQGVSDNPAARRARPPQEGLILLYPISKHSGFDLEMGSIRRPLYANVEDPRARDLIGMAISFPQSAHPQQVEAYLEGTVGWRPVE